MKRTAKVILKRGKDGWILSENKITCSVIGEMEDGVKVWADIETQKQYGLLRMLGKCYFYKF